MDIIIVKTILLFLNYVLAALTIAMGILIAEYVKSIVKIHRKKRR
jgi:hypothetical protein